MPATTRDNPDDDAFTTLGPDARVYERYAQVELDEDTVVVYDIEVETAWISSDMVVTLTEAV